MGFQVSPGVEIREIDLTTIVPSIATTAAGMAGVFNWGPCHVRTLIDSENNLRDTFGSPDNTSAPFFFTAANFLGYGNNLQVVRVVGASAGNAYPGGNTINQVLNQADYDNGIPTEVNASKFFAKYPGVIGSSLAVYSQDGPGSSTFGVTGSAAVGDTTVNLLRGTSGSLRLDIDDIIEIDYGTRGTRSFQVSAAVSATTGTSIPVSLKTPVTFATGIGNTATVKHRYSQIFGNNPTTTFGVNAAGGANDEIHVAVIDTTGKWSGIPGTVLESFESLSKSPLATKANGENIYYKNVINRDSKYIWVGGSHLTNQSTGDNTTTYTDIPGGDLSAPPWGATGGAAGVFYESFAGGAGGTLSDNTAELYNSGYAEFEDSSTVDVSLILGGPSDAITQQLIVDLCDKRKDCIAFLSPVGSPGTEYDIVVGKSLGEQSSSVLNFRNTTLNKSSSYAFLDSGYKYMYDRYNDVYRNIPLNGDIAGLCARTEQDAEAWFSPAGFTRGQVRGVVKLPFNPKQTHRDNLYKDQVNPVVAFPGEGTILYGDKTLQSKPSSFDRINVRRLFIILEKAIATAAKFQLFEFNDAFTRSQFQNLIIPFLRDVQARRGIYDFKVVADETNNPPSVVDRNEFIADIYVKPTKSINFIRLNFISTATGVNFNEIGG